MDSRAARSIILALVAVLTIAGEAGCRRRAPSNANLSEPSFVPADPKEAQRQSQSLVELGKEFYKNDEDEEAAKRFQQALILDPNNAEAHLRLGMSYGALER